ncbi:hypothetical protein [Anaeromyxobacter dehalogenans]|nr:hypothetical protein [Anaeromyxobacter dehalogenans]
MPPFLAQDPLDALRHAGPPGWAEVAWAVAGVASEPWALALLGLALYSWLEREVPAVLKAVAPLWAALAAAGALAAGAQGVLSAPRPADAGDLLVTTFRHLASAPGLPLGVFVGYTLLAYGRRGRAALLVAAAGGAARAWSGPHWGPDLLGGGLAGAAIAWAVWAAVLRASPRGHLARLRASRRATADGTAQEGHPAP